MQSITDTKTVCVVPGAVLVDNHRFDLQGRALSTVRETCDFLQTQPCFARMRVISLDLMDSTPLPSSSFLVRIILMAELEHSSRDTSRALLVSPRLSGTLFPPLTGLPLYAILHGSFDSSMTGDLRVFFGDTVTVVADLNNGWVEGVTYGRHGRFPHIKLVPVGDVRRQAECGHAEAQRELGLRYLFGRGLPKDASLAVPWFRKAAEQGFAWGQRNLAQQLARGNGVEKNELEAFKWYLSAAEQNDMDSQYDLGVCYNKGFGVTPNKVEALRWFTRAAQRGDRDAQFFLATGFQGGIDCKQDLKEAVLWYRKAAEQDHAKSQFNLGLCLMRGVGVTKDTAEATKWFRLAAELGLASAQHLVADFCSAEAKDAEALYWYCKAAEQGNEKAQSAVRNTVNGGSYLTKLS